jgi:hypothetical protein
VAARLGPSRGPDVPTLVAGLTIAALGGVLLLDRTDTVDFRFAVFGPVVFAVIGAILLATGLSRRD